MKLLDWLERLGKKNLCHVSTAYVCGTRKGRILENDLEFGQGFRNSYEHSKYEAESLLRSRFTGQLTVLRPTVVVGHSLTGVTTGYHGIYKFFQFTWMYAQARNRDRDRYEKWEHRVRLRLDGDEVRNLVPVDWCSEVIATHFYALPV